MTRVSTYRITARAFSRVAVVVAVLVSGATTGCDNGGGAVAPEVMYRPANQAIYFSDGYHGGRIFPGAADAAAALAEILALVERFPVYRVTLELEGALWEDLLRDPQYHDVLERLRQRIADGRVELVGGTYSQPFFYPNNGESLIRQFLIGLDIVERGFGFRQVTYAAQEPGFTTQLPQILRGMGFRFVKLTNRWMAFGSPPAFDNTLFRWRGPDGSTIPTSPRYGSQGQIEYWATPIFGSKGLDLFPDRPLLDASYRSGVAAPYTVTLEDLLANNLTPWCGEDLPREPPAFVRWATPRAYFEEILRPQVGGEPVALTEQMIAADRIVDHPWGGVPDDALPFPWGVAGGEVQRASRTMERAVLETERWSALASLATDAPYPDIQLDKMWRDALWAQNHDVWVVFPPAFLDTSSEAALLEEAGALTQDALARLPAAIDTQHAVPGMPVVVFNPTSRSTRGIAGAPLAGLVDDPTSVRVTDDGGAPVPFQVVAASSTAGSLLLAADVPAIGYRAYYVSQTAAAGAPVPPAVAAAIDGTRARLESDLYLAEVDLAHGGALTRLFDKALGIELVRPARPVNTVRGYFPDLAAWVTTESLPAVRAEVVESGPLRAVLHFEIPDYPVPLRVQLTLSAGVKRLDTEVEADFGSGVRVGSDAYGPESWRVNREKMSVRLPLLAAHDIVRDAPFHVEATGRTAFWANRFAAAPLDDRYVAVLLDRPSALVRSDDGVSLVLAYGGDYLYPPAQLAGSVRYAYAFTSGTGLWGSDGPAVRADERDYPLRAVSAPRHGGGLPVAGSFLHVSDGATVTAIFYAGGQPRVRVFNSSPAPIDVSLQATVGPPLTRLLDLRGGEAGETLMPLQIPPFGLMTVGAAGAALFPPSTEMPAAAPAQVSGLPPRSEPQRVRLYLKPDFTLASREPPLPRPWEERLAPAVERTFLGPPTPAALTFADPGSATLFFAVKGARPPQSNAPIRIKVEVDANDRRLAAGEALLGLANCEPRFESYLTPLCAVPVTVPLVLMPGEQLGDGERLSARIWFETEGRLPLLLLYDSTHYPSRIELPAPDLFAVAAVQPATDRVQRIAVEIDDRMGSGDILDVIVEMRSPAASSPLFVPLGFERDLSPTRSLWTGELAAPLPAGTAEATVVARNLARTTAIRAPATED